MRLIMFTALLSLFGSTSVQAEAPRSVTILDVRTPEEFQEGHVTGAQNIDWSQPTFKEQVAKLDKSGTYKLYCAVGGRSGKAAEWMKSMGFKDVENLGGVRDASKKLKLTCVGPKGC